MSVAELLLVFFAFLFLIMLASIWSLNFFTRHYIGKKHYDLEEIAVTHRIPEHWSADFEKRISRLQKNGSDKERSARIRQSADKRNTRKLEALIKYVKKTRLVEDEETRILLLERLQNLHEQKDKGNRNEPRVANK